MSFLTLWLMQYVSVLSFNRWRYSSCLCAIDPIMSSSTKKTYHCTTYLSIFITLSRNLIMRPHTFHSPLTIFITLSPHIWYNKLTMFLSSFSFHSPHILYSTSPLTFDITPSPHIWYNILTVLLASDLSLPSHSICHTYPILLPLTGRSPHIWHSTIPSPFTPLTFSIATYLTLRHHEFYYNINFSL